MSALMNLPPIGEETLVLCMVIAATAGALVGFALGYTLKEKKHAREIESIIRITKRIAEVKPQKERAPQTTEPKPLNHRLLANLIQPPGSSGFD